MARDENNIQKRNIIDILKTLKNKNNKEPLPDIAICSNCGWRGHVSKCDTEQEGDWKSGYYYEHICPKCDEEASRIDSYSISKKRTEEW